jgi:signal transduction histidine kinase
MPKSQAARLLPAPASPGKSGEVAGQAPARRSRPSAQRNVTPLRRKRRGKRRGASRDATIAVLKKRLREWEEDTAALRARLRAERMRLSLILSSLVAGVVLTDCRGRVLLVNDSARRMLGLPASGPPPPLRPGTPLTNLLRRMRLPNRRGVKMGSLRLPATGSSEIRTLVAPLRDRRDLLWGTLAILEESAAGGRLNEMKSDFISRVSHELRTPLASIRAASDVISQAKIGSLNPKQEKMLRIISQETGTLVSLIEDLLDMSEIESGRLSLRFRRCSLAEVARASLDHFRARYQEKQVALLESLPAVCPTVQADADRIGQVFDHLLSNALKFTPAGGRVDLKVTVQGSGKGGGGRKILQASITDNGIGIARADLEKIFEKFHQTESVDTRSAGGSGLGLSISKFLVEAHGGEIWVESRPGEGSTFYFSLPAA